MDKCVEAVACGGVVDVVYFDFAKAFDTVPHRRLIDKMKAYGINGKLLGWIKDFLTTRSQVVRVNGECSSKASVLSGIPQGSVLGPLLFIVYINDLPDDVISDILMFADDTKIFHQINSKEDSLLLQSDTQSLLEWSKKWLLTFNKEKCHVLTIGKIENIKHTHRYSLDDTELEHVFSEKDLGLTIDSDLKFEEHISMKVNKANAMMGLIRRCFSCLDIDIFRRLYTTFVRPHLEYAQSIWSPHFLKQINLIENVQIRATKLVDGLGKLDYSDRLKRLGLTTLRYRRERGDMIQLYRHFHSFDVATLPSSFQPSSRSSRNHPFQLKWLKPKDGVTGAQANSFYYRTTKRWNDLPRDVVNAPSINAFKARLDEAWEKNPVKYDHKLSSDS